MSIKRIVGVVGAFLMISFIIAIPVSADSWDDGWVEEAHPSVISGGDPSKVEGARPHADLEAEKALLTVIEGVSISEQPQDVSVNWPDGATFHVEVNNPHNIHLNYQWSISDGDQVFEPEGATSPTFELPSTYANMGHLWFCCIITDDDGNRMFTDDAELSIANPGEVKPVVYIGEYALEPGESLDLETIDYGTGTVTFDNNGADVVFNEVQMEDPEYKTAWNFSLTQGFLLINSAYYAEDSGTYDPADYEGLPTEYHFTFIGDNKFGSKYYDEIGAGTVFQTYFAARNNPERPTIFLEGTGTLTLEGGSFSYISDAHLSIGIDVNTKSNEETFYGDGYGIQALNITVEEGVTLNLDNHNTPLRAYADGLVNGSLYINDEAVLDITATPGIGGNAYTGNDLMSAEDYVVIKNAEINLQGKLITERFTPINEHRIHHFVGISGGEGITIEDSTIDITIDVPEHPDGLFAANIMGIKSGYHTPLSISGSDVTITLTSPESVTVSGIDAGGETVIEDSDVIIKVSGLGRVSGIIASEDSLDITDSNVDVEVEGDSYDDPYDDEDVEEIYGIIGQPLTIDINDNAHQVSAKTNRGAAIISIDDASIEGDDRPGYNPDYEPSLFGLKNKAEVIFPEDGVISSYTYATNNNRIFTLAETVYNPDKTVSLDTVITAEEEEEVPVPDTSATDTTDTPETPETGKNVADALGATPIIIGSTLAGIMILAFAAKKFIRVRKF